MRGFLVGKVHHVVGGSDMFLQTLFHPRDQGTQLLDFTLQFLHRFVQLTSKVLVVRDLLLNAYDSLFHPRMITRVTANS